MEKKSKKSIIIGITSIFLIMLLLLGLTYAYYRTRVIGNQSTDPSVSVTAKKMEVIYEDGTATMSMTGLIEPGFTASKTFYVKNTGDETVNYSVILDDMNNEYIRNQDWQVTLTKNGVEVIKPSDNVYLIKDSQQVLLNKESIVASKTSTPNVDTYILTIKYLETDDDQSIDMGKNLSFKVNIGEEIIEPIVNPWENASEGTLLYALKANQPSGSETSIIGKNPSAANEKRIVEIEDDYGISLVYRGNITNNYVTYSNMCWRIVRIQGNGTIKIALADGQHPCGTANGYNASDEDSGFIVDSNGNVLKNISYIENMTYGLSDFVFENSDIPGLLSDWAGVNNKNLDMSDIETAEWCNDTAHTVTIYYNDNFQEVEEGDPAINPQKTVHMFGNYNKNLRLENFEASLKCKKNGVEGSVGSEANATIYINKLGVLTAEEVAFAGLEKSYLKDNTTGSTYFTMSPYSIEPYAGDSPLVYVVDYGRLGITFVGSNSGMNQSVRPSIVLRSDVLLATNLSYTQDGTIDKPYVIG